MYDSSRLKGRIIEKFGTLADFCKRLGINQGTLTSRLHGRSYWRQDEIAHIILLLEIPKDEVSVYFFSEKY